MRAGKDTNTSATADSKQKTIASRLSPKRSSPKSTAAARASPQNRRVASPKGTTKAGASNGTLATKSPKNTRAGYNTTASARKAQGTLSQSHNFDKGGTGNTYENAAKDSSSRLYNRAKPAAASTKNSSAQKSRLKQPSPPGKTQAARRAGTKNAPVSAHNYSKSTAATKTTKKHSFQQNVSKKIQGLKDLQIETYDATKGRPSLMDIDNKQVFEGNFLPASMQQMPEQYTPQLGANPLSSTGKSGFTSNPSQHQSNQNGLIQSPATLGQVSVKGINGPAHPTANDHDGQGNTKFNSSQGMKFKKKSQIEEQQLNKILESRARISINSQTGKHEFKYCQNSTSNLRPSQAQDAGGQAYLQNSDSLVNYINDQNGGQLDQMAPIRPSNLIWQMPYEERRSFINQQCEFQLNRLSKMNGNTGMFGSGAPAKPESQGAGLGVDKQDSVDFVKASGSDSEFEYLDDYVDEAEEFNGASRAVKLSIRALNFNMMLADKQSEQDPNSHRKVSLLSRASNLVQNSNKNENLRNTSQKNYDRSSKLLNLYMKQQTSSQGRDSYLMMSGIDEREEFDEYSHTDSVHSNMQSRGGASKNASSRGSTLKNQYNFPTFFTPSQSSKKITLEHMNAKHSGTTTSQGKQIKFFGAGVHKHTLSQHHSQRSALDRSAISEKDQEDSQAVDEEITTSDYATGQRSQDRQQYVSGKFSQQVSMMQESFQEEPEDPEADVVDDEENTGNCPAADEGYSDGYGDQDGQYIQGRHSRPSAQLQLASQFSDEVANESEQQQTFHKHHQGGIVVDEPRENEHFQQTQKVKQEALDHQQKTMKQSQSHTVSGNQFLRSAHDNAEEQTEERFVAETGNSQPTSFVGQNGDHGDPGSRAPLTEHQEQSLRVVEQNTSEFSAHQQLYQAARLKDAQQNLIDTSIHYCDNEGQPLDSGPTNRSGALMDKGIQQQPGMHQQVVNLESDGIGITERTDDEQFNDSFQNEDSNNQNANNPGGDTGYAMGSQVSGGANSLLQNQLQQHQYTLNASHSPTTFHNSGLQSSSYPYVDRLKTTERNPLTMSDNTTIERSDLNFIGNAYHGQEGAYHGQDGNYMGQDGAYHTQEGDADENQPLACSYDQPQHENGENGNQGNPLNQFVTKVPQADVGQADADNSQQNLHQQHFVQTVQALQFIQNNIRVVEEHEMSDLIVDLPPPRFPDRQKKLAIFDMDETLIHCVDDIETQDPDIVLEIDFPDEETVYAGINIRPYIMECLEEANKHFQVIAFTASHQVYADAILDYIDPNHEYITHRLYRQHCFLTEEGYYVKDLRIFADRDLKDVVIVDNSVYSFAFQIDNGIPIIPFYNDKQDEEMLHLVYYLNCLAKADDVREQNRQAFELFKLSNGESLQNSTMATEAVPGQFYDNEQDEQDGYFGNSEVVDLSNAEGQQYADVDLRDPALMQHLPPSQRQHYQIDDVIHEDCREDFNSYNESGPKSKNTDDSNLQQHSNEHYHGQMNHGNEGNYRDIDDVDAVNEFTEEQPTEGEESSPLMYDHDGNQVSGGGHLGQMQHHQQYSHAGYPVNQGSHMGMPEEDALSGSQINEENSIIMNNNNNILNNDETIMNQHHSYQQQQQIVMTGDILDQDDDGGNFFLGTEGENAPADENSNCYRLSSQMDDQQDPYTRPSKLLNDEEDEQYEALQKQIQDSLNCDFQGNQNQQQYHFVDQNNNI